MHCYKLTIAYDGTSYNGWQIQLNATSIQQHVQNAVSIAMGKGEKIAVIGSGRTDTGVHALNQVAHFKTEKKCDLNRLRFSLNGLLPSDIRIKKVEEMPLDFHSQYSAIGKEYHYHLFLDAIMNPFRRLYCWHMRRKLNLDLLQEAAGLFIGTHDFTSFANESYTGSAARDPVRTLFRLDICLSQEELRLEFEGEGFLYKMVRNIVGTLIDVALNQLPITQIPLIFEAKDRRLASSAAPPQGLFLVKVSYPSHFNHEENEAHYDLQ